MEHVEQTGRHCLFKYTVNQHSFIVSNVFFVTQNKNLHAGLEHSLFFFCCFAIVKLTVIYLASLNVYHQSISQSIVRLIIITDLKSCLS